MGSSGHVTGISCSWQPEITGWPFEFKEANTVYSNMSLQKVTSHDLSRTSSLGGVAQCLASDGRHLLG